MAMTMINNYHNNTLFMNPTIQNQQNPQVGSDLDISDEDENFFINSNVIQEIFIDYKYNSRVLSICEVKIPKKLSKTSNSSSSSSSSSLYRIVSAKYKNQTISIELLKLFLKQAIQNVILSPKSYENNNKITKKNGPSSPVCVSSFPEDSHIFDQLYDKRVIMALKNLLFKCSDDELSPSELIPDHIPILISIEGNIGAGKSTFFLLFFSLSHLNYSNSSK